MRIATTLVAIAAFAAVAHAAVAVPGLATELIEMKYTNFEVGRAYGQGQNSDGTYTGVDAVNDLVGTTVPGAIGSIPTGTYAGEAEDAWGIFKISEIKIEGTANQLFQDGDNGVELVGMFYGLVDQQVTLSGNEAEILAAGGYFKLYAQPEDQFDESLGTAGRTGFDSYTGVGSHPDSVLLIDAVTTPGSLDIGIGEWGTVFTQTSAAGAGTGDTSFFLDVIGGEWAESVEVGSFFFDSVYPLLGPSEKGDMAGLSTLKPTTTADWLLISEDPVVGNFVVIPEPMTMGAFGMAIAGLGGYIRRRRR